jgi:hypothetical protein
MNARENGKKSNRSIFTYSNNNVGGPSSSLTNTPIVGVKYIVNSLSVRGTAYDNTVGSSERFCVLIQKHDVIAFNSFSGTAACKVFKYWYK